MVRVVKQVVPWAAWLLIVACAFIRVTNLIAPDLWFATDPRMFAPPANGFGPAGSLGLDLLTILGVVLALGHEVLAGRRLDRIAIGLWLVPAPVIWWHAGASIDNAFLGMSWLAAVGTGVAMLHLARDGVLRTLTLSAAMALLAPLAIKATYQFFVEHPLTAEEFQRTEAQVLQAHGWEADSAQAAIYRRRLGQAEATGWFAISNVFGTVIASIAVFWAGVLVTAARSRLSSGWLGLLGIFAAAGMWGLALTLSKGAIAVTLIAIAVSFMPAVPRAWRRRIARLAPLLALALALGLMSGVAFRGAVLGEAITLDNYSLLFRWHYWQGAISMWLGDPVVGVGPGRFQASYLLHKPPVSPEDVSDSHSAVMMWIATLGLFGLAWIVLAARFVRHAAPRAVTRSADPGAVAETARHSQTAAVDAVLGQAESPVGNRFEALPRYIWWLPPIAVALVVSTTGWVASGAAMFVDFAYFWWPLSWIAFVLLSAALPWIGRHTSWGLLRFAVFASVLLIALHSLIEMSLTQVGSAGWLFLVLGAAAAASARGGRTSTPAPPETAPAPAPAAATVPHDAPATEPARRAPDLLVVGACVMLVMLPAVIVQRAVANEQAALARAHQDLARVGTLRAELAAAVGGTTGSLVERIEALERISRTLRTAGIANDVPGMLREAETAAGRGDVPRINRALSDAVTALNRALEQYDLVQIREAMPDLETAMTRRLRIGRGPDPLTAGIAEAAVWQVPDDLTPPREMARLWYSLALANDAAGLLVDRNRALGTALTVAERMPVAQPRTAGAWSFAANLHRLAGELKAGDAASGASRTTTTGEAAADLSLALPSLDEAIAKAIAMPSDDHLARAIDLQRQAAALDPYGLSTALRMAELLDLAGGHADDALAWYQRVLEIEHQMRLDPLRRLSDRERNRLERRIEALSPSRGGGG